MSWDANAASMAEQRNYEIRRLKDELQVMTDWVKDLQSGQYVNCVYCGHRYGPNDGKTPVAMADVLKEHIEVCPKHPMSALKKKLEEAEKYTKYWKVTANNYATSLDERDKKLSRLRVIEYAGKLVLDWYDNQNRSLAEIANAIKALRNAMEVKL